MEPVTLLPSPSPVPLGNGIRPDGEPDWEELERITRELPDSDGVPLETPWHFLSIALLRDVLSHYWRHRDDFFVGGNMFIYYSLSRLFTEDFRGPDFFYVKGVERHRPRTKWVVWAENGKYPNLIVELLSPTTAHLDRTVKKDLYEQTFRTPEYFLVNPDGCRLEGWRLEKTRYEPIRADERGWLWSEQLELWLGPWTGKYQEEEGTWLRCYDASGQLVPTAAEAGISLAEQEKHRAEMAEAEIARLKAILAESEKGPSA